MKFRNTVIFGDSYSTFDGFIPKEFDSWYFDDDSEKTDVKKVEQTWWYNIFDGKDNVLLKNNSFSGSTICNTVRPELTIDSSFISRFDKMTDDGFFDRNKVDTFLIFGGTNDSWIDVPIGNLQFENFKKQDLLNFLPATGYLASRINEILPNANVFWLINTELKECVTQGIKEIANHFNQEYIAFSEIQKQSGHPNIVGMQQIRTTLEKI